MSLPIEIAPTFLLASSSEYRKSILSKLGFAFQSASPEVDESRLFGESATDLVKRLSLLKAKSLRCEFNQHFIIGSDQVAVIVNNHDEILGKPLTKAEAHVQLRKCSAQTVRFFTGLTLINPNGNVQTEYETFDVTFRNLSEQQIERYINADMPLDCAGSFKSEGLGVALFEKMHGRDPNTLVGLPLIMLCDMLIKEGIDILTL